jgi:hypothetical protein
MKSYRGFWVPAFAVTLFAMSSAIASAQDAVKFSEGSNDIAATSSIQPTKESGLTQTCVSQRLPSSEPGRSVAPGEPVRKLSMVHPRARGI